LKQNKRSKREKNLQRKKNEKNVFCIACFKPNFRINHNMFCPYSQKVKARLGKNNWIKNVLDHLNLDCEILNSFVEKNKKRKD